MFNVSKIGLLGACVAVISAISFPAFAEQRITTKAACASVQVYFGQRQSCNSCDFNKQEFLIVANKNFRCVDKKK